MVDFGVNVDLVAACWVCINEVHPREIEHVEGFSADDSNVAVPIEEATCVAARIAQAHHCHIRCRLLQVELLIVEEPILLGQLDEFPTIIPQFLHVEMPSSHCVIMHASGIGGGRRRNVEFESDMEDTV